jgi:hypothetical protein
MDTITSSVAELDSATLLSFMFTTQKNVIRDEKLVHGRSDSGL